MRIILLYPIIQLFFACGTNTFEDLEPDNAAARAALRLEAQEPGAAIEIIMDTLGKDYQDIYESAAVGTNMNTYRAALNTEMYKLQEAGVKEIFKVVSVLSSAHAQLHGIDPFDVALALAREDSEEEEAADAAPVVTDSEGNDVTKLFPILPSATAENILGLDVSIAILQSIDSINYSDSDGYKEAIFLTSSVSLVTKKLDLNADGDISADEILGLGQDGAASAIMNQLRAASAAMSSSSGVGGNDSAEGAAKINAIITEIDSQPGATDEERLAAYFAASQ